MMKKFDSIEHGKNAAEVVHLVHKFDVSLELGAVNKHATLWNCPLAWDTGASFGLTPFRADFIDYVECQIPVKDISKTNIVVGIGTTLHKFMIEGEPIWLPCLSYHLPTHC